MYSAKSSQLYMFATTMRNLQYHQEQPKKPGEYDNFVWTRTAAFIVHNTRRESPLIQSHAFKNRGSCAAPLLSGYSLPATHAAKNP